MLIFNFLIFIIAFYFLVKSSDIIVEKAYIIGNSFGLSSFFIGFFILGFGTSLPEFVSSLISLYKDSSLIIPNIIGSNIANVLLVLGLALFFFKKRVSYKDSLLNLFITIFVSLLLLVNKSIGFFSGLILLLFFIFLFKLFSSGNLEEVNEKAFFKDYLFLFFSFLILFFSADLIIDNLIFFADYFSISASLLSFSILAFGTSLPELIVTITAFFKKKKELGLGNIVGSNFFNMTFILGFSALFKNLFLVPFNISFLLFFLLEAIILFLLSTRLFIYNRFFSIIMIISYFLFLINLFF